jgi:hypothetical protein
MIDQVDRQLDEWVRQTLDVPTSLTPPADAQGERGVNLYLLELVRKPPLRSTRRPPLQVSLRYLVTTWSDDVEEAHRWLGELVFAAMEEPEFEVELEPVPAATWAALGVAPRPAFGLCVPLRLERAEPETKLVRLPLVIEGGTLASLRGVVLTPDDVPLASAVVEIPGLQLSTRTDARGQFCFSNVPGKSRVDKLRIRARGLECDAVVDQSVSDDGPVVIRFDPFD